MVETMARLWHRCPLLLLAVLSSFTICHYAVADDLFEDLGEHSGPYVVDLDDRNFEHDTQAATGATTGHWMVEFYAPWCRHCQEFAPVYESAAKALHGRVNFAKVDVTKNRELGERFGISAFPTIKYFRKGQMYTFHGKRSKQALVDFAKEGFGDSLDGPVPNPATYFSVVKATALAAVADVKYLVEIRPHATSIVFILGVAAGCMIGLVAAPLTVSKAESYSRDSKKRQ